MKIAVYTIAKNEEKFASRWAQSCAEADYRIVLDTGSTDDTVALLKDAGVTVHAGAVIPWRFDVARNAALALVPPDVDLCIALDMDEVLLPGWREALLPAAGTNVTRVRYRYVWSWKPDGTPDVSYHGDKIHARKTHIWKHPVHEVLKPVDGEVQGYLDGLEIHHHPDPTKSRAQYLPLLEMAVAEDPHDDRNLHYLGREYVFAGRWDDAIRTLEKHLACPRATWAPERAASMGYLAQAMDAIGNPQAAHAYRMKAVIEAPWEREPWVDLLDAAYRRGEFALGVYAATQALRIATRPESYICRGEAWGVKPYDLGSLCAHKIGAHRQARLWAWEAVKLDPADTRLSENLRLMAKLDMDTEPAAV